MEVRSECASPARQHQKAMIETEQCGGCRDMERRRVTVQGWRDPRPGIAQEVLHRLRGEPCLPQGRRRRLANAVCGVEEQLPNYVADDAPCPLSGASRRSVPPISRGAVRVAAPSESAAARRL